METNTFIKKYYWKCHRSLTNIKHFHVCFSSGIYSCIFVTREMTQNFAFAHFFYSTRRFNARRHTSATHRHNVDVCVWSCKTTHISIQHTHHMWNVQVEDHSSAVPTPYPTVVSFPLVNRTFSILQNKYSGVLFASQCSRRWSQRDRESLTTVRWGCIVCSRGISRFLLLFCLFFFCVFNIFDRNSVFLHKRAKTNTLDNWFRFVNNILDFYYRRKSPKGAYWWNFRNSDIMKWVFLWEDKKNTFPVHKRQCLHK